MTGIILAVPLLHRLLRRAIEKIRPTVREIRLLMRRCMTAIRIRIAQAAKEIASAVSSLAMTMTTLAVMWAFFVGEVVRQFVATLRESADVAGTGEDEEFTSFSQAA